MCFVADIELYALSAKECSCVDVCTVSPVDLSAEGTTLTEAFTLMKVSAH